MGLEGPGNLTRHHCVSQSSGYTLIFW